MKRNKKQHADIKLLTTQIETRKIKCAPNNCASYINSMQKKERLQHTQTVVLKHQTGIAEFAGTKPKLPKQKPMLPKHPSVLGSNWHQQRFQFHQTYFKMTMQKMLCCSGHPLALARKFTFAVSATARATQICMCNGNCWGRIFAMTTVGGQFRFVVRLVFQF